MKILITGICGFVGSSLAYELQQFSQAEVFGLDNLSRPGSETNRRRLQDRGIKFFHGDIRNPSDLEPLPKVDWLIDASANPSVLAGLRGLTSSRQLMEHNLSGTVNLLEYCKATGAGFLLLSTSRVYSLGSLAALEVVPSGLRFTPRLGPAISFSVSPNGVTESFPTAAPISLYGAAKLASEIVAFEYAAAFQFPVFVNRCGVLAGGGQFGKPDQGIFSFWLHSWKQRRPLKYIGFGGTGFQVRDALHPHDLAILVAAQLRSGKTSTTPLNVSGGMANSMSLAELSQWCHNRFGPAEVTADPQPRPYDVPWLVLDASRAQTEWAWAPSVTLPAILEEIAQHAEQNSGWLDLSAGT